MEIITTAGNYGLVVAVQDLKDQNKAYAMKSSASLQECAQRRRG